MHFGPAATTCIQNCSSWRQVTAPWGGHLWASGACGRLRRQGLQAVDDVIREAAAAKAGRASRRRRHHRCIAVSTAAGAVHEPARHGRACERCALELRALQLRVLQLREPGQLRDEVVLRAGREPGREAAEPGQRPSRQRLLLHGLLILLILLMLLILLLLLLLLLHEGCSPDGCGRAGHGAHAAISIVRRSCGHVQGLQPAADHAGAEVRSGGVTPRGLCIGACRRPARRFGAVLRSMQRDRSCEEGLRKSTAGDAKSNRGCWCQTKQSKLCGAGNAAEACACRPAFAASPQPSVRHGHAASSVCLLVGATMVRSSIKTIEVTR
jgi:hypothetical protein